MDIFGEPDINQLYWDTNIFLQTQQLNSWGVEENLSTYYDSSSPDGVVSPRGSKNIVSERNRRKKLNDRLFALRAVVPNITKMDKASIIRDAISYIQELNEQEKTIKAQISEFKNNNNHNNNNNNNNNNSPCCVDSDQDYLPSVISSPNKKKRVDNNGGKQYFGSIASSKPSTIHDFEMRVSYVGEKTLLVSLTCSKKEDTLVKLCDLFETLHLNIITAHITTFSGMLFKTIFLKGDEREKEEVRLKIETAMSQLESNLI